MPPAASMRDFADAENLWAETVSAFLSSPSPRILTGRRPWASRLSASYSGVTLSPASNRSSDEMFTTSYSTRKMFVKPRFGTRR